MEDTRALIDSGVVTFGGAATLTDAVKLWGTNVLTGCFVRIDYGAGTEQIKQIASNSATVITVTENWTTVPTLGVNYAILASAGAGSTAPPTAAQIAAAVAGNVVSGAPTHVSVLTTTTVVLAASATRTGVILSNDSNEALYVAVGAAAVMNQGTMLPANGGQLTLGLGKAALAINAISLSGAKNLAIQTFSNA